GRAALKGFGQGEGGAAAAQVDGHQHLLACAPAQIGKDLLVLGAQQGEVPFHEHPVGFAQRDQLLVGVKDRVRVGQGRRGVDLGVVGVDHHPGVAVGASCGGGGGLLHGGPGVVSRHPVDGGECV